MKIRFRIMNINSGKINLPFSGDEKVTSDIKNNLITNENKEELPGIFIASRLTFEDHKNNFFRKVNRKFYALARILVFEQFSMFQIFLCRNRDINPLSANFTK